MIPVGYMAKRVSRKPACLEVAQVTDIYSVSGCISEEFADFIKYWKHNDYWFFDSPEIIRSVAAGNAIPLEGTVLFYYEMYEMEFGGENWRPYTTEQPVSAKVVPPPRKQLEGFDVATFFAATTPECSPLSCNALAKELPVNEHCLFASFDEAKAALTSGKFKNCEPGPYRVFAVYSVPWA